MKYLILISILLTSCAKPRFSGNDPSAEIAPYVEEFVALYGRPLPQIMYLMRDLGDKAGECTHGNDGFKMVSFNEESWAGWCDLQKRALVFHELGHCVLGRAHTPDEETSYMHSELQLCPFYAANREELDIELFL